MITKTYLPSYLCSSSGGSDSNDNSDSIDSNDSSDNTRCSLPAWVTSSSQVWQKPKSREPRLRALYLRDSLVISLARVTKTLAARQHCCEEIFGSLVDFAEILTRSHDILSLNSHQGSHCFLEKFHKSKRLFVPKCPPICIPLCKKFPTKKLQYLLSWKFSTNFCFVVKFTQKIVIFGKFPQKFAYLEIYTNVALWENFHKILLPWKTCKILVFIKIFLQIFSLLENFQNFLY